MQGPSGISQSCAAISENYCVCVCVIFFFSRLITQWIFFEDFCIPSG